MSAPACGPSRRWSPLGPTRVQRGVGGDERGQGMRIRGWEVLNACLDHCSPILYWEQWSTRPLRLPPPRRMCMCMHGWTVDQPYNVLGRFF